MYPVQTKLYPVQGKLYPFQTKSGIPIIKLLKKTFSAVFALSNVRNLLPSNIKNTIYNSLFPSFVETEFQPGREIYKSPKIKKISFHQKRAAKAYLKYKNSFT